MNKILPTQAKRWLLQQCEQHGSFGRGVPDLFFPIRPEPDIQIDCNFTNLMCKNITNV